MLRLMKANGPAMAGSGGCTVAALVRGAAERVPGRTALVVSRGRGRAEEISYARLWDRADRISVGLSGLGLAPRDRVVIMVPVCVDLYAILIGVLKMGAVAVFVSPWLGKESMAAAMECVLPRAYVGGFKSHLLRLVTPGLARIPVAITTGRRFWRFPAPVSLARIESANGDGRIHASGAEEPALISFTSGSSGTPKAANRTHAVLAAQHAALAEEFPVRDDDVDMTMFPVTVLHNLACGITSVVPRIDFRSGARVDPDEVLAEMRTHGVTTFSAPPPAIDLVAARAGAHSSSQFGLRRLLSGGAPVFDPQLAAWRRALPGTELVVAYGSTEAEPVSCITAADRLAVRNEERPLAPGICTGRPSGRIGARLIRIHKGPVALQGGDWSPWDVPRGAVGELVVSGDHVCRDYFGDPGGAEQSKIAGPDGTVWHRMGDTGYFDREGRFWLVGRVHSTIRRDGEDVHPQLLEQAAGGDDPRVRRAAAVGLPDGRSRRRESVVVVVEADDTVGIAEAVTERLRRAGLVFDRILITRDPLPLDPRHNAKIDYRRLRGTVEHELGIGGSDV